MKKARRAAIYVRISKDRTGDGAGVARQEQDCRELAARRSMIVVDVFVDNDVSAYSGKPRPSYERLIHAIEDGAVDAVIVWHTDRLYRRVAELERYIDICQPKKVPTYAVQAAGELDLTTASGRLIARTLGGFAQYESEHKSERQRRANLQRAMEGKNFATKRCFGFEPGNEVLNLVEAEAIRDAYRGLLDGATVASVARRWNALGLTTPQRSNQWDGSTVSQLLRGPRNGGMRVHQGQIVTGADGRPIKAQWPAIVDQDTWHAAQAILRDPRRSFPNGPQLLLSGIALCAVCGDRMVSGGTRGGRRRIRCGAAGGHAYREAAPIDDLVVRVILGYLSRPEISSQLLFDPRHNQDEVARVRNELADIQRRADAIVVGYAAGTVSQTAYVDSQERFVEQRLKLENQLPLSRGATIRRLAEAPDPAVVWEALDIDEKRKVIQELVEVRVMPSRTKEAAYLDWRKRIINPDTVEISWRSPAAEA